MTTPQQIKDEVEKGCGKAISEKGFNWKCGELVGDIKDIQSVKPVLCDECKAKLSILTEYDKSIKEMIGVLRDFVGNCRFKISNESFSKLDNKIEEILSKIGDKQEKQNV